MTLAHSDADARWIGVRRHQAALVVLGLALVGDGVVRSRSPLIEVLVGAVLLACGAPWFDGSTIAEQLFVSLRFASRPHWTMITVRRSGQEARIDARGTATLRGYALDHVGRLDLVDRDTHVAAALARHLDALATAGEDRHVSLHVRTSSERVVTLLALNDPVVPPEGWDRAPDLVETIVDAAGSQSWLLERWGYVRTSRGARTILRVRDFTAAQPGRAVLAPVQLASDQVCVSVHAGVIAAGRGRRLVERAVHRVRSDGATSAAAGFRRTARVDQSFARLQSREAHVAAGRALLRLAVFVTVRSESLAELAVEVRRVRQSLHEAGLVTERGRGRQGEWYCRQLPGGPGW